MTNEKKFRFAPLSGKKIELKGGTGGLIGRITDQWLLGIRESNPAILELIRDSRLPMKQPVLAWSGEFAGKYLTSAVQIYRLTGDPRLGSCIRDFADELIGLQREDGYLGIFPEDCELTGRSGPMKYALDPNDVEGRIETWDSWAHYHIMYALLLWHETSGSEAALTAVRRAAELFISRFYGEGQPRVVETGSEEMNLSVLHVFALLYRKTGEARYLRFAERLIEDLSVKPAGDYLRLALAGEEFYRMPKPRWESIHPVEGLLEMYAATGDEECRQAAERIWRSITATDVHNTGGFSTCEQAVGSPYRQGPVETCCVVAYMALTADILRMTGDPIAADILELSTLNSSMGSFSPSGRWSTYDTPMEGYKRANYHEISFQCRPGSPELNCCSVNAPRAFGLLEQWAYMEEDGALVVNYYEPQRAELTLSAGRLILRQETDYPYDGRVTLCFEEAPDRELTIKLRVPFWSERAELSVNGEPPVSCKSGYVDLCRRFRPGDTVELRFDMSLRAWVGEERLEGKGSLYYGPLVLCEDPHYDRGRDVEALPILDAGSLRLGKIERTKRAGRTFTVGDGTNELVLCDLYTAGATGSPYTTWLPMTGIKPRPFTRENPFRLQRVGLS